MSVLAAVRWHRAGAVLIWCSFVLFVAMQAVSGDWLPPEISFSQYGVGTDGWIFSLYLVALALGPLCLNRANPTGRAVTAMLLIGAAGCVLMAAVHTDPGGLQQSARAKVHMVGSVIGLSLVPLGSCLSMVRARVLPRWVPISLTGFSGVCMVLLLISATGVDTLGVGAATSWAYWQTGAALADIALMVAFAWRNVPALHARTGENRHTTVTGTVVGRGSK